MGNGTAFLKVFKGVVFHHQPCASPQRVTTALLSCTGSQTRAQPPAFGRVTVAAHPWVFQQGRNHPHLLQVRAVTTSTASNNPERDSGSQKKPGKKTLSERIGMIGVGMMGEALLKGFLNSGISSPGRISCSVSSVQRRQMLEDIGVGNVFEDARQGGAKDVAANSDIIILGVKPQALPPIMEALAPHITPRHLIISVAAGVRLARLEAGLGQEAKVVRVMPNTPCLVQCGASAYALGSKATPKDADLVHELFSSVGLAIAVDEKMMDAVTGVSGSGPAYIFLIIEALADGGVAAGLPRDTALALAAKTVAGAAGMVMQDGGSSSRGGLDLTHPGVLKDRVASPAGTTIAGLMQLEEGGVRGSIMRAVKASANRSQELA